MPNPDDYDLCLKNVSSVFITCLISLYRGFDGTPAKELNEKRGYEEIINPTLNGCLNILKAAQKNNIRNIIIFSSTSSSNPNPSVDVKNEADQCYDEIEQCKAKKYTSASKTMMGKAAIKYCKENNIRLSILLPTGLHGDAIMPEHLKHNPFVWIKRALEWGYPRHAKIPNDSASMIHLRDLVELFLVCHENKNAEGRYFGVYKSLNWKQIYKECKNIIPNMWMPETLKEIAIKPTGFNFKRWDSLGVRIRDFKSTLKDTVNWIKSRPFE